MVHECQPVLGIVYCSDKPIISSKALIRSRIQGKVLKSTSFSTMCGYSGYTCVNRGRNSICSFPSSLAFSPVVHWNPWAACRCSWIKVSFLKDD